MTYSFLSETKREAVHLESLKILQEVGVRFCSEKALVLLRQAGARVDRENRRSHYPYHTNQKEYLK